MVNGATVDMHSCSSPEVINAMLMLVSTPLLLALETNQLTQFSLLSTVQMAVEMLFAISGGVLTTWSLDTSNLMFHGTFLKLLR